MSLTSFYRRRNRFLLFFVFLLCVWLVWNSLQLFALHTVSDEDYSGNPRPPNLNLSPKEAAFELELLEDERRMVPGLGDSGAAVELQGNEAEEAQQVMQTEAFNLVLSKKIPYNRTLRDSRHPDCQKLTYPEELPSVSVIIIFTDERWSTLVRTIHSVLNMSPRKYLNEIILVDDYSVHDELKGKLDYYVKTRLPALVKLIRLKEREGLIRARLRGAEEATSDVLLFLDAHCEVTQDWLRPLLARIKEDRTNVVVPIIDVIDDKTFQYQNNGGSFDFEIGGFTWSGHFTWIDVPKAEASQRKSLSDPTKSPTMAGGLFAIDRKYFWEIGSYDKEMEIWGGENLELSFRVWQCGGQLETIPCSRVGHIFRNFHPYHFPGDKDTHGINTARLVRVWWDDYQRLFFRIRGDLKHINIGDTSERLRLKKKLHCKPFRWYLDNVYKKFVLDEDVIAWGRARTKEEVCLDNLQKEEDTTQDLGLYSCNAELSNSQYFSLSVSGELRREFICARAKSSKIPTLVEMVKCDGSKDQTWRLTQDGLMVHEGTDLCLDGKTNAKGLVQLDHCHPSSSSQIWTWDHTPLPKYRQHS